MRRKKITIYDIAKEAGVSTATVSRVINENANVSTDKRNKIKELLKKYNFVPDALAIGLRKTQTNTIGIIASDLRNPFFSNLLIECEKVANMNNYTIFSCDSLESADIELNHLMRLNSQKVDAIIQIGGSSDKKKHDKQYMACIKEISKRIPIITTGYAYCNNSFSVTTDEAKAMRILLEYLINLGHVEIAFIAGNSNGKSEIEKRNEYKKILKRRSIPYKSIYVIESDYEKESGYKSMKKLLSYKELPTAVIVINEMTAIGAIKAIKERGLRIPDDISLACFDNTYISESVKPAMTSVGCNYVKFAEKLIYLTLDAINYGITDINNYVESVFVVRDSVAER